MLTQREAPGPVEAGDAIVGIYAWVLVVCVDVYLLHVGCADSCARPRVPRVV